MYGRRNVGGDIYLRASSLLGSFVVRPRAVINFAYSRGELEAGREPPKYAFNNSGRLYRRNSIT